MRRGLVLRVPEALCACGLARVLGKGLAGPVCSSMGRLCASTTTCLPYLPWQLAVPRAV